MRKFNFKNLKIRNILLVVFLIILTFFAGYFLWRSFIFLPDDYSLSRKEALLQGDPTVPEVVDFSMIENIDSAVLAGDFSKSRIDNIIDAYTKKGFLIKDDSFIRASRKRLTYRFGTGASGIWVDDRSSIILPSQCSLSYNINIKKNSRFEFSVLSPLSGGKLIVEILNGLNSVVKKEIKLSAYTHIYSASDIGIKSNNIGYPKAVADLGWKDVTISLPDSLREGVIRFSLHSGEGNAFIANPRLFRKSKKKRHNVIYLIMDGISTPYYSFYNSESKLTPITKEIAEKDFIIFDNLFTLGDKTRISTCGIFTSVMPIKTRHGINRNYIPEEEKELFYKYTRQDKLASLPDVFRRQGYISCQLGNSGFTVDLINTGVDYGFERSYEFSTNPYNSYGISHRLFDFLRKNRDHEFFLYLHYNTPHKPFFAPANYYIKGVLDSPAQAWWRPHFNACISYSDDVFSHIYEALKKNNLLNNTIIVFASDHGAGFHVDKFDSGTQYLEYLRMPFMIHLPEDLKKKYGIGGKRVKNYVSAINIAPTLIELTGLKKPECFDGHSFLDLLTGKYNKEFFDNQIWSFGRKQITLLTPDLFKYTMTMPDAKRFVKRERIRYGLEREIPYEVLYDIKNDPLEKNNLIIKEKSILKKMRKIFFDKDFHHPEKTVVSFLPSTSRDKKITVDVLCESPFLFYDLYDDDIKLIKDSVTKIKIPGGARFTFSVIKKPAHFIFENEDDRKIMQISVKKNEQLINPRNIYTTYLNLNTSGNPLVLKNRVDFKLLNDTKLPKIEDFFDKNNGLRVKIVRIDLHRWIDIRNLELTGIGAGMKETLKAWGYIQ